VSSGLIFYIVLLLLLGRESLSPADSSHVVSGAMRSLRGGTEAPLWAPASLPTYQDHDRKYYVADVHHSRLDYKVDLYTCWDNSSTQEMLEECGGLHDYFGSFGLTLFSDEREARNSFTSFVAVNCSKGASRYPPRRVQIQSSLTGSLWANAGAPELRWQYNGWRFTLCWEGDPDGTRAVAAARRLIEMFNSYPMPSEGYVVEFVRFDGFHIVFTWLEKRALVKVFGWTPDYGMRLTSAMRPWREP
jgi:hypothetical protein